MLCEMCGKEVAMTSRVRIEGSVLAVCDGCARFGERLDPVPAPAPAAVRPRAAPFAPRATSGARRLAERDLYQDIGEMDLAADWPKRIRSAREARTWTPEELGKRLNEKKSVVLKLESGSFRPPDALVRKLEHLLQVRLRAEPETPAGSA